MARHRAGPATVQRAIAALSARGLVEARPGRGTFVAARAAAPSRPTRRGRPSPLGARAIDADALETLLRPPAPGAFVLSSGYLPGRAAADGARSARRWRAPRGGRARGTACRWRASTGLRAYFAAEVGRAPRATC